jgi:hypothetical protein
MLDYAEKSAEKPVDEEVEVLKGLLAAVQIERDQARVERDLLREELEDTQRTNTKLLGWQDCARELLNNRT